MLVGVPFQCVPAHYGGYDVVLIDSTKSCGKQNKSSSVVFTILVHRSKK